MLYCEVKRAGQTGIHTLLYQRTQAYEILGGNNK
jgi:hypothetical protein